MPMIHIYIFVFNADLPDNNEDEKFAEWSSSPQGKFEGFAMKIMKERAKSVANIDFT